MQPNRIVSREQWIEARKTHRAHEKELMQARERLSRERRAPPWVRVNKEYAFDGRDGKTTLAGLFAGRSQLVVPGRGFAAWERVGGSGESLSRFTPPRPFRLQW